jgi:putative transposase
MKKCIKIVLNKCNELDWKDLNKILWEIQKVTFKACNEMIRMYYLWDKDKLDYKDKYKEYPNEKELFGKKYNNVVEERNKEIMYMCNTNNTGQTNQLVEKKYKDLRSKILNGEVSIPSFKRDIPIYLKNSSYVVRNLENNKYEVELRLFNNEYKKKYKEEFGFEVLTFEVAKLNGNELATLNKIISGEYKQGMCHLKQNKKNKWCLTLSFSFEANKKLLDHNRILGVDLGIVNTATMSIWDNNYQKWDRLSWHKRVIDGKEIIHFRQKIRERRLSILRASKLAEYNTGKAGHGRKTRTQSIDKITGKVDDFRNTYNHKVSRYIVDFATKNNCGVIQMENLSGFSQYADETFLKEWSYFDLQNKVKYKAEEVGIELRLINPKYTSQRCSQCGCINEKNRSCKNNQAKFKCVGCGCEENADINAAKNIALPNIEEIIKKYKEVINI